MNTPKSNIGESAILSYKGSNIPIRNIWHMLVYAVNFEVKINRNRQIFESAPSIQYLLASILARLVQQRLRVGLGRDFERDIQLLNRLRGRIDFGMSVKGLTLQKNKLTANFLNSTPTYQKIR